MSEAEIIGQGGSGRVYRARQDAFDRDVAIKIIPLYGDERTQRRFDRERRAMGRLSGVAGVLPVHESGTTEAGDLYLVMPFISGGSLREQLGTGEIAWTQACDIVEAVARTTELAHEAGIVHRDIKPGNILIGDDGTPLLADFGIARLGLDATGTTGTGLTLTPAYGPPEAFDKAEPSVHGDVYSLGATLWALIAGRPPFTDVGEEPTLSQLFARVVSSPVGDLRQLAPQRVCEVIERAMAKDPAERFASAADFADALADARKTAGGFAPEPGALAAGWTVKVAPAAGEASIAPAGAAGVQTGSSRRVRVFAVAAVLLAVAGIVAALMTRGGDGADGVATTADADAVTSSDEAVSNSGGSAGQAGGAELAADDETPEVSDTGDAEVLGEAQSSEGDDGEPFLLATPSPTPTPDPSVAGDEPTETGEAAEVVATPTSTPVPAPQRDQPSPTPAPTRTPTPAPDSSAPAPPSTPTSTPRPTSTPIPTPTNTPTPTPTPTPTNTPTPTPLPGPGPLGLTWFLPQFPCDGQTHDYALLTNATPGGTVSFSGPSARPGVGVVSADGWLRLQWDCTNTEVQTFTFRAHDDATGRFVDYSFQGSADF